MKFLQPTCEQLPEQVQAVSVVDEDWRDWQDMLQVRAMEILQLRIALTSVDPLV
jgi:hypothetical protein